MNADIWQKPPQNVVIYTAIKLSSIILLYINSSILFNPSNRYFLVLCTNHNPSFCHIKGKYELPSLAIRVTSISNTCRGKAIDYRICKKNMNIGEIQSITQKASSSTDFVIYVSSKIVTRVITSSLEVLFGTVVLAIHSACRQGSVKDQSQVFYSPFAKFI